MWDKFKDGEVQKIIGQYFKYCFFFLLYNKAQINDLKKNQEN